MKLKSSLPHNSELAHKIHQLDKYLNDAIKRFSLLAKIAESKVLTSYFIKKSEERKAFKKALNTHIRAVQIKPTAQGTASGAFTRLQANIKAAFGKDGDEVSLTKAIYQEESLLYEYELVLDKPELLPDDLKDVLQKQKATINKDLNKIKTFNDLL